MQVLYQSYFLPTSLKAVAVTATRRGIASKQLLLGTQANQVFGDSERQHADSACHVLTAKAEITLQA